MEEYFMVQVFITFIFTCVAIIGLTAFFIVKD